MKLRMLNVVVLTALSLSALADNSTSSNPNDAIDAQASQTTKNLATAALHGSVMLPKNPNAAAASNSGTNNPITLANDTDRISYSIGYDIGHNFKNQNISMNPAAIEQGIVDGLAGNQPLMQQKDMQSTLLNFQNQLIAKRQSQMAQISSQNQKASQAFLADNKTKPGVVTTADGLQYKVIKDGQGATPTDKDLVTVNYQGSLPTGEVFDSSYVRGKPVTFPVSEVIQGWSEALKLMKTGSVWEIYVPPALAYGDRGIGPIGPNQVLIFKIELLAVNPPSAKPAAPATSTN